MAYSMYNNQYYMQDLQSMKDRIENQIRQIQQAQAQAQQQQPIAQPITQNFQLAPQNNNELESKYADNIEQVRNTFVVKTGIFLTKDFGTIWIKDVSGNIRTFRTEEVIEMDEKDKEIYELKKQIEEMKGMIKNANESGYADVNEQITEQKSSRLQNGKRSNTK